MLAVALEGSIESSLPRRTLTCHAGDVWTEPGGDAHGNEVGRSGARVLVLQPDPERHELLRPAMTLLDGVHHLSATAVASIARRALPELTAEDGLAALHLEGLALEMLALSARLTDHPRPALPGGFRRALERIHDDFRRPITVSGLAEEAGLHPAHFARVFRRHTGASVGAYVRELRVAWACQRMVETDATLGQIALQAGFADQSHFSRTFKRLRGMTPRAYRASRAL